MKSSSEVEQVRQELAEVKDLLARVLASLSRRGGEESVRLLTAVEVAKLTGYKVAHTHAMIARGEIPSIAVGEKGQRRVPLVALRELIKLKLSAGSVDPDLLERISTML